MDVLQNTVIDLIRQRPPFVMIDRISSCDEKGVTTVFTIRHDNIFLDGSFFSVPGVIENMAQSCAARMGIVNRGDNDVIKEGVIGEIRDFVIIRQPLMNEQLVTRVQVIQEVFNLSLAQVEVCINEEVIATAEMKIALIG